MLWSHEEVHRLRPYYTGRKMRNLELCPDGLIAMSLNSFALDVFAMRERSIQSCSDRVTLANHCPLSVTILS